MNRHQFVRTTALCWVLGLSAVGAWGQSVIRTLPLNSERGVMEVTAPPEVLLNGQPARLSPGSRIRDARNMLALSGSLVGQKLLVNYKLEPTGLLHEVWILTQEEADKKWSPAEAPKP